MSRTDRLQPASFRGVAFKVDSDDLQVGRRTVLHEYPGRDTPSVEDMGRETREYAISAYLIGPDFIAERDRLIDHVTLFAKENPAMVQGLLAGAGALVALKLAAYGANTALSLIGNTAKMSPLGMFLRVATFGVAYLAANWDKYGPAIQAHMGEIKAVAALLTSYMLVFQLRWLKAAAIAGNAGPFMRGLGVLKLLAGGAFGAGTAFKVLWGILRMNPLGILLTAIMLVIENWDAMTKGFDVAMKSLREFLGLSKTAEKISADLNAGVAAKDTLPAYTTGKLGQQTTTFTYGSSYQPGTLAKSYNGSVENKVSGEMVVRFENAPQNLRVDEGKTSPGWSMSPDVGYSRYAK